MGGGASELDSVLDSELEDIDSEEAGLLDFLDFLALLASFLAAFFFAFLAFFAAFLAFLAPLEGLDFLECWESALFSIADFLGIE